MIQEAKPQVALSVYPPAAPTLADQAADADMRLPRWTGSAGMREVKKDTPMPKDFVVSEFAVKCGRGKENYIHEGNRRLRCMINEYRETYLKAPCRSQKSAIVLDIVHAIRKRFRKEEQRPDGVGAFVKYDKRMGRWVDVGDINAREKVGHALRGKPYPKSHVLPELKRPSKSPCEYIEKRQRALLAAIMQEEEDTSTTPLACASSSTASPTHYEDDNQETCNITIEIPPCLSKQVSLMAPSLDPTWNLQNLDDDLILADLDLSDVESCSSSSLLDDCFTSLSSAIVDI